MEGLPIRETRRLRYSCGSGELLLHARAWKTGHDPSQGVDVVGNEFPGIGNRRFCRASTAVIPAVWRLRRPNVLYFSGGAAVGAFFSTSLIFFTPLTFSVLFSGARSVTSSRSYINLSKLFGFSEQKACVVQIFRTKT